jgi:hypothetical protein
MGQLAPYIPPKDADLQTWALNFSTVLTASPASFGLVAADATTVASVYATWNAAFLAAVNPSTRTPTTIAAKDDAKILLLATVRPYAQLIANNAGVSAPNKTSIGVNPRTSVPTPIAAPATSPVLTIDQALPLQHVMRYRDQLASPTQKAKPYGAAQIQVFATVSATPITDPEALAYKFATTKSPVLVDFGADDVGKKAYYAGRWITRTGLVGPWSPITSFTVAA